MPQHNGEKLGGFEQKPIKLKVSEDTDFEIIREKYYGLIEKIEETLNRNSQVEIVELRNRLQSSSDEIMQRFGNCLDQIGIRKDWNQSKIDAYKAVKDLFDEWIGKQEKSKQ